ncbi:MAG: hypothetical protein JW825_01265 [Candidatus Methanofastidiosa archaeon]|nr:hypothetical protein [Candidatus Methanofastidiosa archaeon]
MKQKILDSIMEMRCEIGIEERTPVITRAHESGDRLFIECEDRADKSIVIGTGGWVVGKLAASMGYKEIKVESRLDNIMMTKRLIRSLRSIKDAGDDDFTKMSRSLLTGEGRSDVEVLVLGEEMLWACGFLKDHGCKARLLHTGFLHDNLKEAYDNTTFVGVDCVESPYRERLDGLVSCIGSSGIEGGTNIVFGYFGKALDRVGDLILVNPMAFYGINYWNAKKYAKKKFRSKIAGISQENRAMLVKGVLDMTFDGMIEPNDAAKLICQNWPELEFELDMDHKEQDPFVKEYRIRNALARARMIDQRVYRALENHLNGRQEDVGVRALVAWSGGIDSTACIKIAAGMGLSIDPVMVCLPHIDIGAMEDSAASIGVDPVFLDLPDGYDNIYDSACKGHIHPCGQCSSLIQEAVLDFARSHDYEMVIFGDMLSCGSQSIVTQDGIMILNLPAALSIPKKELLEISGMEASCVFGCPLLDKSHKVNNGNRRVSVQRVLRELRAQMMDKQYAIDLIEHIMT